MNKSILKTIVLALFLQGAINSFACADMSKIQEIDLLRAELSTLNKTSAQYTKTKHKLEKLISQNKIDYSTQARINDIERLIKEQKFNSATYELNDLIENGVELSTCYMLLGDISAKSSKPAKKTASLYKEALKNNQDNYLASYRLAKLYLKENKNILGIEYLKYTIQITDNDKLLKEIEYIIQNKITPQDRYDANNLYEALGEIYKKQNKKMDSYIAFAKAIQINPKDIFLKYQLGDMLFCDCKDREAVTIYDDILKDYPNDTMIRISKAKALANEGNLLSADKEFRQVLNINPNSPSAIYGLYKIYERKLPPDKILEKIYPNKANLTANKKEYLNFANFLAEMNDEKGSLNFKKYVSKLDEIEKEKQLAKSRALEIERLKQEKIKQEKLKQEEKLKLQKENEAKKLAQIEANKKAKELEQRKKTQEEIQKAKEKQKELEQNKKAQLEKQKQEQHKKQLELNEKKQKEYENKVIQQERQKAITKNPKKYNEYKATIDKYLKMTPKDASIYVAIANTYKLMGEPTSALQNYREALKLNPTDSDIYYNLGLTYMELNSFQTAKANLIKAVNLNKENEKAINLLAFVNQKIITQTINNAYELFEKKEYIKASAILDKGLKNYPKNAQMLYYRALVYDAMNRNAAQIIDLQKAIEYDPGYYMAYYQLGKAYEKIKDEKSALVAYEKFLSTEPEEKDLINEVQKKVIALGAKYY